MDDQPNPLSLPEAPPRRRSDRADRPGIEVPPSPPILPDPAVLPGGAAAPRGRPPRRAGHGGPAGPPAPPRPDPRAAQPRPGRAATAALAARSGVALRHPSAGRGRAGALAGFSLGPTGA